MYYVSDAVLGWLYVFVIHAGWTTWERRRAVSDSEGADGREPGEIDFMRSMSVARLRTRSVSFAYCGSSAHSG